MDSSVTLPQELWNDILLRLPVKCLASVKCVCKSWFSLITDPSFAESHFDLALTPSDTTLLLSLELNHAPQITSIDLNAPLLHLDALALPIPQPIKPSHIIGSCRGFLLIQSFPHLYLWNPCTGLRRQIPYPPIDVNPRCQFLKRFGYDSCTDDYLITLGCRDTTGGFPFADSAVIFSVRANTWNQLDDVALQTLKGRKLYSKTGLFFNGAIHWIANCGWDDPLLLDVYVILAFDLRERVFFEIAMPDCLINVKDCELRLIGGRFLGVFDEEIWVMEEYKVRSSWKCLVSFDTLDLGGEDDGVFPICLTPGGDIVGTGSLFEELVKLNCQGQVLDRRHYYDSSYSNRPLVTAVMHTHTLLSLPCTNTTN